MKLTSGNKVLPPPQRKNVITVSKWLITVRHAFILHRFFSTTYATASYLEFSSRVSTKIQSSLSPSPAKYNRTLSCHARFDRTVCTNDHVSGPVCRHVSYSVPQIRSRCTWLAYHGYLKAHVLLSPQYATFPSSQCGRYRIIA